MYFCYMEILNIVKLTILFVILALLGFNIFTYLAKGTDILGTIFSTTGKDISRGAQRTLEYVGIGSKKIEKTAASSFASTKDSTSKTASSSSLRTAVDNGKSSTSTTSNIRPDSSSDSQIQRGAPKGWCYIGHTRGVRSCIHVNNINMCQSGKVYPSQAVCVNPRLRYANGSSAADDTPYDRRRRRRRRRRQRRRDRYNQTPPPSTTNGSTNGTSNGTSSNGSSSNGSSSNGSSGLEKYPHNQWHSNQPPTTSNGSSNGSNGSSNGSNGSSNGSNGSSNGSNGSSNGSNGSSNRSSSGIRESWRNFIQ